MKLTKYIIVAKINEVKAATEIKKGILDSSIKAIPESKTKTKLKVTYSKPVDKTFIQSVGILFK